MSGRDAYAAGALAVWKYKLTPELCTLEMPAGATVLHVDAQRHSGMDGVWDDACLWALVDPQAPTEPREFLTVGTGHGIAPAPLQHLGSLLMDGGSLVFHVFERTPAG